MPFFPSYNQCIHRHTGGLENDFGVTLQHGIIHRRTGGLEKSQALRKLL